MITASFREQSAKLALHIEPGSECVQRCLQAFVSPPTENAAALHNECWLCSITALLRCEQGLLRPAPVCVEAVAVPMLAEPPRILWQPCSSPSRPKLRRRRALEQARGPQPRPRSKRNIARCEAGPAPLHQDLGTGASPARRLRAGAFPQEAATQRRFAAVGPSTEGRESNCNGNTLAFLAPSRGYVTGPPSGTRCSQVGCIAGAR